MTTKHDYKFAKEWLTKAIQEVKKNSTISLTTGDVLFYMGVIPLNDHYYEVKRTLEQATLAERERCARVASDTPARVVTGIEVCNRSDIAAAIRKGE